MASPYFVENVEMSDSPPLLDIEEAEVGEIGVVTAQPSDQKFADKCEICNSKALGFNYFAVSCNACKMFFRRVSVGKLEYKCRLSGECFENIDKQTVRPNCKACRFKKCIEVGMKYSANNRTDVEAGKLPLVLIDYEESLTFLIAPLLHLDSQREHHFQNMYTNINPSMAEILSRPAKGFSGPLVGLEKDIPLDKWSFFGVLTSVEFLSHLDFMTEIELPDKVILVKNFAMKSLFLASCFRSKQDKYDRVVVPNGMDVYPDSVLQIPTFTVSFLNRIRKLLVTHLIGIRITPEEYILATIILFCNSALSGLSSRAQSIINKRQKLYCGVLLKYCLWKYRSNGPARLHEIISLGTVLSNMIQDVQSLDALFKIYVPNKKQFTLIEECLLDNEISL